MNSAQSTLTPSHVEPARIRQVLEDVLSRPDHEAAQPGLLQRALMWVLDAISRLIELLGQGDRGAIVGTVLLVVTVGTTVLIIAYLLRRIRRDRGADSPHAGIAGRTAQDWRDRAHQAEAAQDWPEALRCHYRALLAELVAAGVTDEVHGWTARDYLRDVSAAAPGAEPALARVTSAFEATWYGRRPTGASDVESVRAATDSVLRATLVTR